MVITQQLIHCPIGRNRWRAPGSAPVQDACGLAGGSYSRSAGAEAGDYAKTMYAQHGDVGTQVLKPLPDYTPPTYTTGGTAEVTWSMRNNHGGGYARPNCHTSPPNHEKQNWKRSGITVEIEWGLSGA